MGERGYRTPVGSENTRDRARSADHGNGRARARRHLRERRGDAAGEVEERVADVSQSVLDVVAEDPEEEHVSRDVREPGVQEHVTDQRGGAGERMGRQLRGDEGPAAEGVGVSACRRGRHLQAEDAEVERDQRVVDAGHRVRGQMITNG